MNAISQFDRALRLHQAGQLDEARADRDLFDQYTAGRHPFDFRVFVALAGRGRTVITPVSSWSTHGEIGQLAPLVDWRRLEDDFTTETQRHRGTEAQSMNLLPLRGVHERRRQCF